MFMYENVMKKSTAKSIGQLEMGKNLQIFQKEMVIKNAEKLVLRPNVSAAKCLSAQMCPNVCAQILQTVFASRS